MLVCLSRSLVFRTSRKCAHPNGQIGNVWCTTLHWSFVISKASHPINPCLHWWTCHRLRPLRSLRQIQRRPLLLRRRRSVFHFDHRIPSRPHCVPHYRLFNHQPCPSLVSPSYLVDVIPSLYCSSYDLLYTRNNSMNFFWHVACVCN